MSEYKPDDWRKLARLLRARRAQLDARYSKRSVFCEETGLNYKLVSDVEGAPETRTTFAPETFALFERAYHWAPGSIESVLGGGDPAEVATITGEATLGVTASVTATAEATRTDDGLMAAIRELARRLSPENVRALLEEFAHDDPDNDNPYRDPAERHIWAMRELSEGHRRQLIIMLQAIRSTADLEASPAHQARATPTAEVREFRQRG